MEDNFTTANLRRLSDADLEVAEHEPDVRGWTMVASDGDELGEVDDLIVDTNAMKVRYLEVEPAEKHRIGKDEALFIPIQNVDVNRDQKRVVLRGTAQTMRGMVAPGFAAQLGSRPADAGRASRLEADEVRRMTRAEEEIHVGTRPVQTGEVRVGKHVETERVRENVPVTREDVRVERRPVSGSRSAEIRASEDEIRVPIVDEEVVVEKRPIVKEEVIVGKERVQETRDVDVEARKERVDIHDDRNPDDRTPPKGER